MRIWRAVNCLWPGLPHLWYAGRLRGLLEATGFALLVNTAVICQFVWTELTSDFVERALWAAVAGAWLIGFVRNWRDWPRVVEGQVQSDEHLFLQAQREYLRGHWIEAQDVLERLLDKWPDDCDARLMLATLLRHTRQLEAARRQLDLLQQYPGSAKWQVEIAHERMRLARLAQQSSVGEDKGVAGPDSPAEDRAVDQAEEGLCDTDGQAARRRAA